MARKLAYDKLVEMMSGRMVTEIYPSVAYRPHSTARASGRIYGLVVLGSLLVIAPVSDRIRYTYFVAGY